MNMRPRATLMVFFHFWFGVHACVSLIYMLSTNTHSIIDINEHILYISMCVFHIPLIWMKAWTTQKKKKHFNSRCHCLLVRVGGIFIYIRVYTKIHFFLLAFNFLFGKIPNLFSFKIH